MEMEVELCAPNLEVLRDGYVKQDICQLSQNFKLSKAQIYFAPKNTLTRKGDKPYIMTSVMCCPRRGRLPDFVG
jgi:hypothetical protein